MEKSIKVVRVALPLNRRTTNDKLKDFGKEIEMGVSVAQNKVVLGNMGMMLKSDYDAGNFAPYNLKPEHIGRKESAVIETALKVNEELAAKLESAQDELERLKAELAAKSSRTKSKEVTNGAE